MVEVETSIMSKGKEVVDVSLAICGERVVRDPMVLQIQKTIYNQSTSMLIDLRLNHNLMLSKLASNLILLVSKIQPCKIF